MLLFLRFLAVVCAICFGVPQAQAQDAEVPFTFGGDTILNSALGATSLEVDERNTCDSEFWEVMKDRAWMEAQREITQNQNIMVRPDSVLQLSCFHGFMNHLSDYSWNNYPMDPDESFDDIFMGSGVASFWFDLGLVNLDEIYALIKLGVDHGDARGDALGLPGSQGFTLDTTIELLVLDQLWDLDDDSLDAAGIIDDPFFAFCSKERYIEDNFKGTGGSHRLLGGRAIAETTTVSDPAPEWDEMLGTMRDELDEDRDYAYSLTNHCTEMARVWMRAKCYDFATESSLDIHRTSADMQGAEEHDGFYTLEEYKDKYLAGEDYRVHSATCDVVDNNDDGLDDNFYLDISAIQSDIDSGSYPTGSLVDAFADSIDDYADQLGDEISDILSGSGISDYGCTYVTHHDYDFVPKLPFGALYPFPGSNPNWQTAYDGAYPVAGALGALDIYKDFLEIRNVDFNGGDCAVPVQTGIVVSRAGADPYVDAFCPTPGCYFDPPADVSGLGTCERP